MRKGSTLNGVPPSPSLFEEPATLEKATPGYLMWQIGSLFLWGYVGAEFWYYLPFSVLIVVRLAWPLLIAALAYGVFKQHCWLSTYGLPPDERQEARKRLMRGAFWRAMAWPFIWWYGAFFCLRRPGELLRALYLWWVYNRQAVTAPGILVSPVGSQPVRVWWYRLTVLVVAVGSIDCLGLLTFLAVCGVIGPALKELEETRNA